MVLRCQNFMQKTNIKISENKKRKMALVESVLGDLKKYESPWFFVFNYSGLNAKKTYDLRTAIRKSNSGVFVLKNTIGSIVLSNIGLQNVGAILSGQCAIVVSSDPVSVAKLLKSATDSKDISVLCYSDGKTLYDANSLTSLSNLPSLDVLRARLLGMLLSVPTKLVRTLLEPSTSLVRVIKAWADGRGSN